jgi:hypothetical protein
VTRKLPDKDTFGSYSLVHTSKRYPMYNIVPFEDQLQAKKPEEMKLLAEKDKKYKKIPKRGKRGASSYPDETPSRYDECV